MPVARPYGAGLHEASTDGVTPTSKVCPSCPLSAVRCVKESVIAHDPTLAESGLVEQLTAM